MHYDREYIHIQTIMLLNTYKILEIIHNKKSFTLVKIDVETQFKKMKIKSLVAWSISEGKDGLETDI